MGYLVLAYTLIIIVDILNVFNTQAYLVGRFRVPLLWYQLFKESGPTEVLQWLYMTLNVLVAGAVVGLCIALRKPHATTLSIMAVGLGLMLLEDTAAIRHKLSHFLTSNAGIENGLRSPLGISFEIAFFGVLAILMIYPVYELRHMILGDPKLKRYFSIGYVSYGVGAVISATRHIGNWYCIVGENIITSLGLDGISTWSIGMRNLEEEQGRKLGFFILEALVEESLEMVGAAFVCAALVVLFRSYWREAINSGPRTTPLAPEKSGSLGMADQQAREMQGERQDPQIQPQKQRE